MEKLSLYPRIAQNKITG